RRKTCSAPAVQAKAPRRGEGVFGCNGRAPALLVLFEHLEACLLTFIQGLKAENAPLFVFRFSLVRLEECVCGCLLGLRTGLELASPRASQASVSTHSNSWLLSSLQASTGLMG